MFTKLLIDKFGSSSNRTSNAFMIRWIIIRTKWFNIFVHKFLKSDENLPHSHPFNFISVLLWGSYVEQVYTGNELIEIKRRAPSIMFRNGFIFHKIILKKSSPITICLTWPAGKNWHYLTNNGEVIKWRKYLRQTK